MWLMGTFAISETRQQRTHGGTMQQAGAGHVAATNSDQSTDVNSMKRQQHQQQRTAGVVRSFKNHLVLAVWRGGRLQLESTCWALNGFQIFFCSFYVIVPFSTSLAGRKVLQSARLYCLS